MITLTTENWRQEIDQAKLPNILKSIVGDYLNDSIPPEAYDWDIMVVQQKTQGELEIDRVPYNIVVFVPDNSETHRRFFTLVKKYPGGKLTSLGDAMSQLNLEYLEGVFSGIKLDVN